MHEVSIARNYADALLTLARKADDTAGWGTLISALGDAVAQDATLRHFLEAPQVSADQKRRILHQALADKAPALFVRFVQKLVTNRRQMLLPEIAVAYHDLLDEAEGRVHARVTVSREYDAAGREAITLALGAAFKKTVVTHMAVDPRILGGVVVRVGDTVMDGSVKRKLGRLRETAWWLRAEAGAGAGRQRRARCSETEGRRARRPSYLSPRSASDSFLMPSDDSSRIDRRGFFSRGFQRAVQEAVEAFAGRVAPGRHVRPPGALPEPAFLGACTRCGACTDACPVQAIRPLPQSARVGRRDAGARCRDNSMHHVRDDAVRGRVPDSGTGLASLGLARCADGGDHHRRRALYRIPRCGVRDLRPRLPGGAGRARAG
jgi:F-type H+-transporting ATPase subunit delta